VRTGCGAATGRVTIVIPALNEAHHLAELMPQILGQTLAPLEVLVADAGSSDGTADMARAHGARVVAGGRPAEGRNNGAHAGRGDWLCFVDADTRLPSRHLLERVMCAADRDGAAAMLCNYRPYYRPGDRGFDRPLVRLWDRLMLRSVSDAQRGCARFGFPVGQAVFLATRRDVFLALGGFAQAAEPFEDSAYLLQVHRRCPPPARRRSAVGVMPRDCYVQVSTRRYDVLGRLRFPTSMAIRGTLLRWALAREQPNHDYWDVNRLGMYRERREAGDQAGIRDQGSGAAGRSRT
jgi:glycosyltransferase involved in cell wall biosynthesis